MSAYNHRTAYFERNFIMMIGRCPFFLLRSTAVFALACALCLGASAQTPAPVKYDSGTISGLTARNIGSATMGGRISAIDAVDENGKITVFVGSASGGVWKSINGATTFRPVFDREPAQSIGAVTIDPTNHKNVWVGKGGKLEQKKRFLSPYEY